MLLNYGSKWKKKVFADDNNDDDDGQMDGWWCLSVCVCREREREKHAFSDCCTT